MRSFGPGPGAEREPAPGPRPWLGAAVILALGLAALPFTARPWYDPTPDGSMYLITARSLLDGTGYALNGEPFRVRPPGFSAMLAPLLAAGGGFLAINVLVGAFGALAAAALYAVQRPRLGAPLAALVAASLWLMPKFRILSNQVMSDVPGVALLLVALLVERWASRRPSVGREIVLGLVVGAFAWVRTVVALLLPALLLSRALDRLLGGEREEGGMVRFAGRRLLPVTVVVVLVQLPWSLWTRPGPDSQPSDQAGLFSYSTAMTHRDGGDPFSPERPLVRSIRKRLPDRIPEMIGSLGSGLVSEKETPGRKAFTALLLLGSLWVLVKRRTPADFYVPISLALLAVYFGFQPRLLLPVWVIAFPALVETVRDAAGRFLPGRAATAVAAVALVAWGAVTVKSPRAGWDAAREAHERRRAAAAAVAAELPPDSRLGAFLGWNASVYLDRPVTTLRFHIVRVGDVARGTEEMIAKYGIDRILVRPDDPQDGPLRDYLLERYGSGAFTPAGPFELVRVRPSG